MLNSRSFNLFQNLTLYESDVRFARFAYFRNGPWSSAGSAERRLKGLR